MKTKLILLVSFLTFFLAENTEAQTTNYCDQSKVISQQGYAYQSVVKDGMVDLFNKNNKFTYTEWKRKDGSPVGIEIADGEIDLIVDETWTKPICKGIVNHAFTFDQAERVKGVKFDITMTIDTSSGDVIEVQFWFLAGDPFCTIPLSVFREIEVNLKRDVFFNLTETGKKLNFIKRGWMHDVDPKGAKPE